MHAACILRRLRLIRSTSEINAGLVLWYYTDGYHSFKIRIPSLWKLVVEIACVFSVDGTQGANGNRDRGVGIKVVIFANAVLQGKTIR